MAAEVEKYKNIALDFGSYSRRANGSVLTIYGLQRNAKDGTQVYRDGLIYLFPERQARIGLF